MERRLKAELWDKMHYLFRDYNDRMVHVELHYDFDLNVDAFKTVLAASAGERYNKLSRKSTAGKRPAAQATARLRLRRRSLRAGFRERNP